MGPIVSRSRAKIRDAARRLLVRRGCKQKETPHALRLPAMAALAFATGIAPAAAQTLSVRPAASVADQAARPGQRAAAFEDRDEPTQRNPFAPSRHSLEFANGGAGPGGTRFRPNSASIRLPKLKLRGLVQGDQQGDQVTALLEVDTVGVFVVRKGDIIGLPNGGSDNVIKVNEITDLSVVVEVGSLGQFIIVR